MSAPPVESPSLKTIARLSVTMSHGSQYCPVALMSVGVERSTSSAAMPMPSSRRWISSGGRLRSADAGVCQASGAGGCRCSGGLEELPPVWRECAFRPVVRTGATVPAEVRPIAISLNNIARSIVFDPTRLSSTLRLRPEGSAGPPRGGA
jgi:hypothetical protein